MGAVAPRRNVTSIPRGYYNDIARVLGARFDHDGNFHVIREELSQDEIARRYQDELAKRYGVQPLSLKSREGFLAEGFDEVYFSYDEIDYAGPLDEQSSKGGLLWNFRLPNFLHTRNLAGKPTEVQEPLPAPKRNPQPNSVGAAAKPKPTTPKVRATVTANPKAPSAPSTHIYYHQGLKVFSGHIHNKPFKPMDEKGLYRHLLVNHALTGSHAEQFINRLKAGSTSGFEPVTASHHLDHAHRFAALALDHHNAGNLEMREKHVQLVLKHIDHAHEMFTKHLKKNPEATSLGHNHPVYHQIQRIHGLMHLMDDDYKKY
jgi:hypothetical protein